MVVLTEVVFEAAIYIVIITSRNVAHSTSSTISKGRVVIFCSNGISSIGSRVEKVVDVRRANITIGLTTGIMRVHQHD